MGKLFKSKKLARFDGELSEEYIGKLESRMGKHRITSKDIEVNHDFYMTLCRFDIFKKSDSASNIHRVLLRHFKIMEKINDRR